MKNKIKEVQNYFADKLARGLYKVGEITDHTMKVTVDKQYDFTIWVANGENSFATWANGGNFMQIKFTPGQKATGFRIAQKHKSAWVDTEKREKDLAQLRKLQGKYPDAN